MDWPYWMWFWIWGFLLEQYRLACIPGYWVHPILVPFIVSALWPAVYAINVLRWLLRIP